MITIQKLTSVSVNQSIPILARGLYFLLVANADDTMRVSQDRLDMIYTKKEKNEIDLAILSLESKGLIQRKYQKSLSKKSIIIL